MRKTLLIVILLVIVLAGFGGYIIGTTPFPVSTESSKDSTENAEQSASSDTSTTGAAFNNYDTLLITVDTSPPPLSLQAGAYFDAAAAQTAAKKINTLGYKTTIQQFTTGDDNLLNVVLLGPFANEANLQLAQFELSEKASIATQRVNTPKPPATHTR